MEEVRQDPTLVAKEFGIDVMNHTIPTLHNTDACKRMPFDDNSIDVIYSTNAFHFFVDKLAALQEISRTLRPNGIAVMYMDRTDDIWPSDLFFPRLRIYKKGVLQDGLSFLQGLSDDTCSITIQTVASIGGGDAYILQMKKFGAGQIDMSGITLDARRSISLDAIRYSKEPIEDTLEFRTLRDAGAPFRNDAKKEQFGGYLSCYDVI